MCPLHRANARKAGPSLALGYAENAWRRRGRAVGVQAFRWAGGMADGDMD